MNNIKQKDPSNRHFETGAQRDIATGKLRMSLIPHQELKRVMKRYLDGAEKYGENNWMKGMPLSVFYDSAHRHLDAWWSGRDDEDHAAAVIWNMLCAMWQESQPQVNTEDKNTMDMDDRYTFPKDISK